MRAWVDTNVLVRHLTGDPPAIARRATRFLADAAPGELPLADLVLAEVVYVLESVYELDRAAVADAARAIVTFPAIAVDDVELLLRAVEVFETDRLDFAEAYLAASAERSGVGAVVRFDKTVRCVSHIGNTASRTRRHKLTPRADPAPLAGASSPAGRPPAAGTP